MRWKDGKGDSTKRELQEGEWREITGYSGLEWGAVEVQGHGEEGGSSGRVLEYWNTICCLARIQFGTSSQDSHDTHPVSPPPPGNYGR